MFEVDNQSAISLLSRKTAFKNKSRNLMAIGAIILTTILFSTVFTIAGSLIDQQKQADLILHGGDEHAEVAPITESEYETLLNAADSEEIYYTVLVGTLGNPELYKLNTEVRYGQEGAAASFFSLPTTGQMPEAENEIALSTLVLDALNMPYETGTIIPLEIIMDEETISMDFVLSGYWEGEKTAPAQEVWISHVLGESIAPKATVPFSSATGYTGYMSADIYYSNTFGLIAKTDKLIEKAGLEDASYSTNPVLTSEFSTKKPELSNVISIILLLSMIVTAGYLIIYNIFYISVSLDIQHYGLLKTIGTSGRQLKAIVYRQALTLSALGIPFGIAIGWLTGSFLMPYILTQVTTTDTGTYHSSPVMLVIAALFSLLTVFISCRRPCRLVSKISPVDAVRYTENTQSVKSSKRKTGACSPFSMAFAHLLKNRKKVVLVVSSLFLSLTLLNSTFIAVSGFDFDAFVEKYSVADFFISHYTVSSYSDMNNTLDGIDESLIDELEQLPGLQDISYVYAYRGTASLAPKTRDILANTEINPSDTTPLDSGKIDTTCYGIDKDLLPYVSDLPDDFDYKKWNDGNYAIVSPMLLQGDASLDIYETGDTIELLGADGTVHEAEIIAIGEIAYDLSVKYIIGYGIQCIIPENLFNRLYNTNPMNVFFNTESSYTESTEQFVKQYCNDTNPDLDYISRNTYYESFEEDKQTFLMIGGILSLILGLIGILNFTNASATSIFSRRKELAMLEAIGMSNRQMVMMLIYESLWYIILSVGLTATLGTGIGYLLGTSFFSVFWAFQYRFTLLPVLICLPFLILLAIFIPFGYYRKIKSKTVTDRLRVE